MSYLPLSKSGLTISVLKSYLQKSVRRGLIEDACWCIVEIYSYVEIDPVAWKGISTNLINRLAIINLEDVAFLEDLTLVRQLYRIYLKWEGYSLTTPGSNKYQYRSSNKAKHEIIHMVIRLCQAKKSRVVDHAAIIFCGNSSFRSLNRTNPKYSKVYSTGSKDYLSDFYKKKYTVLNHINRSPSKEQLKSYWVSLKNFIDIKPYKFVYERLAKKSGGSLFIIAAIMEYLEGVNLIERKKIIEGVSVNGTPIKILLTYNFYITQNLNWKKYFLEHGSKKVPSWAIDIHTSIKGIPKNMIAKINPTQMTYSSFALIGAKLENKCQPWNPIWDLFECIFLEYMLWKDRQK